MGRINHIEGHGVFWAKDNRVNHLKLWNRLEFERGPGWAKLTIGSSDPEGRTEVISSRIAVVVLILGMIMDIILECGGADVEVIRPGAADCPYDCEGGYIKSDGGNYERCPHCGGED